MIESFVTNFGRGAASWHQLKTDRPPLHFSPANGLPFLAHGFFARRLARIFSVKGQDNRGAWPQQPPPRSNLQWQDHADDLIAFLDGQQEGPVVGVGHSIGGTVTLLAARRRPDLFRALVLIDPAGITGRLQYLVFRYLPKLSPAYGPLVAAARDRQAVWNSRSEFEDYLQSHRALGRFSPEAQRDYARGGLEPDGNGRLKLVFEPAWEAHNFAKTPLAWPWYRDVSTPTLLLTGQFSPLCSPSIVRQQQRNFSPLVTWVTLEGVGHLAVHEDPDLVLRHINDFAAQAAIGT